MPCYLPAPGTPLEVLREYFHPDATWTDVFSVQWGDGNNWLFLHVSDILRMIAHLCASRTVGTLIVPFAAWAPWLASLRQGRRWAAGIKGMVWHRGLACWHPCWTRCSCPKAWIHRTATAARSFAWIFSLERRQAAREGWLNCSGILHSATSSCGISIFCCLERSTSPSRPISHCISTDCGPGRGGNLCRVVFSQERKKLINVSSHVFA